MKSDEIILFCFCNANLYVIWEEELYECMQNECTDMYLESNFESRVVTLGLTFLLDDDDRFWRRAKWKLSLSSIWEPYLS